MNWLVRDLCHAARRLRRTPGFTLTAAGSLGLAIGANAVIFGIVNGLLFKPLPVAAPGQLVRLGSTHGGEGFGTFSYREYRTLLDGVRSLEGLVAHQFNSVTLTVGQEPRTEWMELVSGNYFDVLGVLPKLGRGFLPAEDQIPGAAPVAVISDALWRGRFAADPATVGRSVKVNGKVFTIVGIAPPGFRGTFTGFGVDLWVPTMMQARALPNSGSLDRPTDRFLMLLGRRKAGTAPAQVQSEAQQLARQLAASDTLNYRGYGIRIAAAGGVHPFIASLLTAFLALLQVIVALVLLIACANLVNLLLARAASRRRELAVRAALGAGRLRLARHLLLETLLVALLGGTGGLLLAVWLARVLATVELSVGIPLSLDFRVDLRVTVFTLAVTLLTALLAGVLPAWRTSRPSVLGDLRVAGATADGSRSRLRSALVGVQLTIACVLLVSTDLLVQSLRNSRGVDPGFDPTNVLLLQAEPAQLGYDSARARLLWDRLTEAVRRIPGVESATLALFVPLGSRGDAMNVAAVGGATRPAPQLYNIVAPGYFATLRIALQAGRDFSDADKSGSLPVAILSAAAARRYFGEPRPLGRLLAITDPAGREQRVEVVGVVRDVKYRSLGSSDQAPVYLPAGQWFRSDMVLHVRASSGASSLAAPLTAAAHALEPDLALTLQPMSEATAFALIPMRIAGYVLGFAGATGVLLAVIGVFGVAAYAMSQRLREVGIRLALGATPPEVRRLVLLQGVRPALIGLALGLLGALAASRLLSGFLIEVSPLNPEGLLAVPALLATVSVLAAWLPARRATGVNPVAVLKEE